MLNDALLGTPLAAAAEKGHEGTVQLLLDHGASPNGRGGWFSTPLMSAIAGRNDAIIRTLLEKGANVNAQGGRHVCALMAASFLGNLKTVQELIRRGARVNDENDKGADALHSACTAGHIDIVKYLLENGADVNAKGGKHRNALNAASAEGYLPIVEVLLDAGADPQSFDEHYGNCLQAASFGGHEDIVRTLHGAGVDVNSIGGSQRGTALVCAVAAGRVSTVSLLFELGLNQGPSKDIANAMISASMKGDHEMLSLLLKQGADINACGLKRSGETWTPLQVAAHRGDLDLVEFMIQRKVDPNAIGGLYSTPLMASVDSDKCDIRVIQSLLTAGANVNEMASYTRFASSLVAALSRNNKAAVELLIDHGAKIDLVNANRTSALMCAVENESDDTLDLLLARNADTNLMIDIVYSPSDDGLVFPLEQAAAFGHESAVRKLIAHGARIAPNRKDTVFKDALQAASYYGNVSTAETLLELGADPNNQGGRHGTSLQAAATRGYCNIMTLLLDHGADVNVTGLGQYGNALIAAVASRSIEPVRLLLERKADPNLRAGRGFHHQYALHKAAYDFGELEEPELVKLLVEAGADVNSQGGKYHTALISATAGSLGQPTTVEYLIDQGADVHAVGGVSVCQILPYNPYLSCPSRRHTFCTSTKLVTKRRPQNLYSLIK